MIAVGLGVLFGLAALVYVVEVGVSRLRGPRGPRRLLVVVTHLREAASGSTRTVTGTVVSAPSLRTPLTDRPCVAWSLTLSDGSGATVWRQDRVQDLEIAYDVRWTHDSRRGQPRQADVVAQPGAVEVAGDVIELASIHTRDGSQDIPLDQPALARLHALGLDGDLQWAITAAPAGHHLTEACLTTGDLVRCAQGEHDTNFRLSAGPRPGDGADWIWPLLVLLFLSAAALITGVTLIEGPPFPEPV